MNKMKIEQYIAGQQPGRRVYRYTAKRIKACSWSGTSRLTIPSAPVWADFTHAEAVALIGGLVSPPEQPPFFLMEFNDPPEWEMDKDLCTMLEGLAGTQPFPVKEAVAPSVEDSAASDWSHVPEGTVTRIIRRLVFSVTTVPFFPLDDLVKKFPECSESLLAEICASFVPEEEEEED